MTQFVITFQQQSKIASQFGGQGNGRFVTVVVPVSKAIEIQGLPAENVVVLPRYVLRADHTILVANEDNELEILPVKVLRAEPKKVYLSQGIEGGTKVVITTLDAPVPGTRLAIRGQEDSTQADTVAGSE